MGRGRGAAEHDEDTKVSAVDDPKAVLDKARRVTDDDDSDVEEETLIEKAPEQIAQEEEFRWKQFHYPWWAHYAVYVLFTICLVNVILSLVQHHSTHSSQQPVDYFPRNLREGGWAKESMRYAGAVIGVIGSCLSFVLSPSPAKFQFTFLIMFLSAFFNFWAFADDLYALNRAQDIDICNGALNMELRKFVCKYDRYRAVVILDMIAGVSVFLSALFIFYQAFTGVVTKRKVFNEQTKGWEEIVLGQNDEYWMAFPRRFKKQRPLFNFSMLFCAGLNISLIALSVTQSTLDIYQATNQDTPIYNTGRRTPVDIYILESQEAIPGQLGQGGWPERNFLVRLFASMISLVTLAFLIQWRRDGRKEQLYVIFAGFVGSVMYLASFALDYTLLREVDMGCNYAKPVGMVCDYMKYNVLVAFDGLCCAGMFIFFYAAIIAWMQQARSGRGRSYGWWCFGEWKHEEELERERIAAEEGRA